MGSKILIKKVSVSISKFWCRRKFSVLVSKKFFSKKVSVSVSKFGSKKSLDISNSKATLVALV